MASVTDRSNWMSQLPASCHDKPLNRLAIPGSHDSLAACLDVNGPLSPSSSELITILVSLFGSSVKTIIQRWSRAQALDVTEQLTAGIRYFDLRVAPKPNGDLYLVHGLYTIDSLAKCFHDINTFLNKNSREIVLLDLNHFYLFSAEIHEKLVKLALSTFGPKVCPFMPFEVATLDTLWNNNLQVILLYNNETVTNNHHELWPAKSIQSPWPNTTSPETLISVLEANYLQGLPEDKFYVTQGVLTPNTKYVFEHLNASLEDLATKTLSSTYVKWVGSKKQGLNICITDFVTNYKYIDTVIKLNYVDEESSCLCFG